MFYKNADYTVWTEIIDGQRKYFIKFHCQVGSYELEITQDVFLIYIKEFRKHFERQRNEKRRHIENDGIERFNAQSELVVMFEQETITKADIDAALKMCTPTQRERLKLYYFQGYSFAEIAKMEGCAEAAVRQSVTAGLKKIKKYFS